MVHDAGPGAGSTVSGAVAEWRARRLGARRAQADILLTATAWAIVDQVEGTLDFRDLGLAAYRVERLGWWPWGRRLRRVHRVCARRRPVTTNIRWRPGKGIIGACVARRQVVASDLRELYQGLGSLTKPEWDTQVPDDVRLGLSYEGRAARERDACVGAPTRNGCCEKSTSECALASRWDWAVALSKASR